MSDEIKVEELRIGNWVVYQDDFDRQRYEMQFSLGHFMGIFEKNYGPPEPILMRKEWLDKYGFELLRKKDGTLGVYFNGKASVQLSTNGNVYTMRNKLLSYVHTFQNWYYYDQLTGEELTLKDNE